MQGPYDQFLLFGDSLTQQSCSQAEGFAFAPALQDGMTGFLRFSLRNIPMKSRIISCVLYLFLTVHCAP